MGRSLGLLAVVLGLVTGAIWWARGGRDRTEGGPPPVNVFAETGAPSAALRPVPESLSPPETPAPGGARAFYDPLLLGPCHVVPFQEQEVSSQAEGALLEVRAVLGQQVKQGEVLARLDDRLVRPQVEVLQIKAASDAARLIARAQLEDIEAKVQMAQRLVAKRAFPVSEMQTYLYQRDRYAEELRKADEDQEIARKELEKALRSLELHQIRSGLAGEVTRVYKRAGESVRPTEPLFWVANCDRLRVEGLCKIQQANLIRVGMRAVVEPERRGEQMTELSGHTGAVTCVAVAPDGRLVASASEDRTVLLWDWPSGRRRALLPHPGEVYAVAVGRAGARGYRILTGCADGRMRFWTVSAAGKLEGPVLFEETHEGALRGVALSADGRWCATAGEDKRAGVWDVAARKRLYWLQAEKDGLEVAHQGAVTAVHFTPDGHLVSAGRDNALRVWKLADGGARLVGEYTGRTGDAASPGVSPDGRRLLFDHGEEVRILDRQDGSSLGTLRSRRQGRFSAFAAFSPTGRLVLTAANNGRLQLWTVPAAPEVVRFFRQGYTHGFHRDSLRALGALAPTVPPGVAQAWAAMSAVGKKGQGTLAPQLWRLDGHEVRSFVNPTPSTVRCGAFAPDGFVVFTGGTDRVVRVWGVPALTGDDEPLEAEVTYVGSQVERGTDMVRVRAELQNPRDASRRLRPGTSTYLRLYPETAR